MTLDQLAPEVAGLSRNEKITLLQSLVQDLAANGDLPHIASDRHYEVWSPIQADEAAATLLNLLQTRAKHDAAQ